MYRMDFSEVTAGPQDAGRRLDRILRRYLKEGSLSQIYSALRKGLVKCNGKRARPDDRVTEGSVLSIARFLLAEKPHGMPRRTTIELISLFQNTDVRIIDKPYGVAVHAGGRSGADIAQALRAEHAAHHARDSLSFTPAPLHRLDRRTSGLLICSRSIEGARWISLALRQHLIGKKYLAVIQGHLRQEERWHDAVGAKQRSGSFHTARAGEGGKQADTRAVPLAHGEFCGDAVTLACMDISTGRTHQIRAQAALHGHPLLGDTAYGGKELHGCSRAHYLHAHQLLFPADNPLRIPERITARPPDDFAQLLAKCGIIIETPRHS